MLIRIDLTLSRPLSKDIQTDALDFLMLMDAFSKGYRIAHFKAHYASRLIPIADVKYLGELTTNYAEADLFLWELSLATLLPYHRKFFELPEYKLNHKADI